MLCLLCQISSFTACTKSVLLLQQVGGAGYSPHAGDAPVPGRVELLKSFAAQLKEWGSLLQRFLRSEDDQVSEAGWCS
jgi:hypothetical protein